jgi:hypothetical protein
MSTIVFIPCPRCAGKGVGAWHPDGGICYRCKGNREVKVNIEKSEAALRHLRVKFVELRTAARQGNPLAAEFLKYTRQDGIRLRQDIETAKSLIRS